MLSRNVLKVVLTLLLLAGCAHQKPSLIVPAPSELPGVVRSMKTPAFWISRHPDPDAVIMTKGEISSFNRWVREELGATKDISGAMQKSGAVLTAELKEPWQAFSKDKYYFLDGNVASPDFFTKIKENMNLASIPKEITKHFGIIVHYADQRLLPTDSTLLAEKGDVDFDELENSALNAGTPVAVLQTSQDGNWLYCQGEASSGWVKKENLAFSNLDTVDNWMINSNNYEGWEKVLSFVVVTSPKADIYLDYGMISPYDIVQMGTRFPLLSKDNRDVVKVLIPRRTNEGLLIFTQGYLKRDDVQEGFREYTPRVIIEQAFKLLNAPYGWGGMYGEQDCSRFLQEIFSVVGIELPRNSGEQVKAGKILASFSEQSTADEKNEVILNEAIGGITLLGMKGHIMLYLGEAEGEPFAIHATWAYRENQDEVEVKRVINKVTVSDLSLGENSKRGSLLKRITKITSVLP